MNAVTLTNAARWNLDQAERVAKRGNKRDAEKDAAAVMIVREGVGGWKSDG